MYFLLSCERLELCFLPVQLRDGLEQTELPQNTFWLDHTNTWLGWKDSVVEEQRGRQMKKHCFALNYWTVAIRVWKGNYPEKSISTKWQQHTSLAQKFKPFIGSVKFQHIMGYCFVLFFFFHSVEIWYTAYLRMENENNMKEKWLLCNRTCRFSGLIGSRVIDCGIGWQLPSPEHFVPAVLKIAELSWGIDLGLNAVRAECQCRFAFRKRLVP